MSPATAARTAGRDVRGARTSARVGAATAHPRAPARPVAPGSRRISGPARGNASVRAPALSTLPLHLRLAPAVARIPDHRVLDRMVRGRLWIGAIAFALLGIVAMQLSLLKLNTGIGRALEHESLLRRQNATLRYDVSNLSAGDRVETQAVRMGMTMASPGAIHFLSAGGSDQARRAARSLDASRPASVGSGASATGAPTAGASSGSATTATPGSTPNSSRGSTSTATPGSSSNSSPGSTSTATPGSSSTAPANSTTNVPSPSGSATGAPPSSSPSASSGVGASSGAPMGAGG